MICILCYASTLQINSTSESEVKILFHWKCKIQNLPRAHRCVVMLLLCFNGSLLLIVIKGKIKTHFVLPICYVTLYKEILKKLNIFCISIIV
jgi:hypothetical protein